MMALKAGGGETSGLSSRAMVAKTHRIGKRRSKGTIAGFASGKTGESNSPATPVDVSGETASSEANPAATGSSSSAAQGNQPQHTNDATAVASKPCHYARLALLSTQNSIRMGARMQLSLCPPGRSRRSLQAALRQKARTGQSSAGGRKALPGNFETGGYFGLDKMIGPQSVEDYEDREEDYLLSTNTFDMESEEEASSGDEDEIMNLEGVLSGEPSVLDEEKYLTMSEPLFTAFGAESLAAAQGALMVGGGPGKLPFNHRKLRYFDTVTAQDRQTARQYLKHEAERSRKRNSRLLTKHLRRLQRQERRRLRLEKGESVESEVDSENEDPQEKTLLTGGVSKFDKQMTASMSAAFLLESLSLGAFESIEGMGKCYDGIVAAGVALLEMSRNDAASPKSEEQKPRPCRSDILAALAPLLVTSLEQPSGEVILMLARLRRMCGTERYKRRFVQRVAPCLIRPPGAAIWCLKHQNDMEPILAAAELIFDNAHQVFTKGWYEKGQLYLADSKRAETLNAAAMQLRNLSAEIPSDSLSLAFPSHGHRVRGIFMTAGSSQAKDPKKSSEPLAEWEVIAVDRQIRISISNILSSDWSRVVLLPSKDADPKAKLRKNLSSSTKRPTVLMQSASSEASPRSLTSSPRSPVRMSSAGKTPLSPPNHTLSGHQSAAYTPSAETFEGIFAHNPSNPSEPLTVPSGDRPLSPENIAPTPHQNIVLSPLLNNRGSGDENDGKTLPFVANSTPPRSPMSPKRDGNDASVIGPTAPVSPRRGKAPPPPVSQPLKESVENGPITPFTSTPSNPASAAPLSPSSIVSSGSSEFVSYRPSSTSSLMAQGTVSSQTAHYRTLTSTAAERKRTVAACRALRAQITRFEDAFIQLHGRAPKGAAERAPLATTYSQYREWKRAIRADAACRIQALFRGARTRWTLLRSSDPRVVRVISSRAGRARYSAASQQIIPSSGQERLLNHLGIPVDIGESSSDRQNMSGSLVSTSGSNFEMYGSQSTPSLAPQWANQVVRRRTGSGDRLHESLSSSNAQKSFQPKLSSPNSMGSNEIGNLSLADLQARKRDLKQQLKQYDMNFARKHGRMPVKSEKEPIRHLYENYNALKTQISVLEQEGRQGQASNLQQLNAGYNQQRSSPTRPDSDSSSIESGNNPNMTRSKRKHLKSPPPLSTATSTPTGAPSQDLAALKAEKGQLHQMLRSYEKDFFREHQRQVASFADIKPVASQYRRYKEIKKAIAALQQGNEK